ncbi:MAG: 2-phospho-L-lactate guanylyltransferase [Thaumarchaeota archaeon]|nr:2-phospho-L-lactate guanylyltransferase [Nitrososphaerota archaeon]
MNESRKTTRNRIAIIIPVKSHDPKRRLSSLFDRRQRRQLQLAMLEDTLQAVARAKRIKDAFIISSDPDILKFAGRFGAGGIEEDSDRGVNEAVESAIAELEAYAGWLVMPADLPMIKASDIKTVLELHRMGSSVVISPSEDHGGTNLLLMMKSGTIPLHYDDDSFNKHVSEATERRVPFSVYYSESVAFDVDNAMDVHRYFKFGKRNSTMTFLARTMDRTQKVANGLRKPDDTTLR